MHGVAESSKTLLHRVHDVDFVAEIEAVPLARLSWRGALGRFCNAPGLLTTVPIALLRITES
jgi:hypothetical protein